MNTMMKRGFSKPDADDIIQHVLEKALSAKNIPVEPISQTRRYLRKAARNRGADLLRLGQVVLNACEDAGAIDVDECVADDPEPEDRVLVKGLVRRFTATRVSHGFFAPSGARATSRSPRARARPLARSARRFRRSERTRERSSRAATVIRLLPR